MPCSSSGTRDINVDKSDITQTVQVDKPMLGTLQGLIDRDLVYITSPTKTAKLYIINKVILKVFCVSSPATILQLTYLLFWL